MGGQYLRKNSGFTLTEAIVIVAVVSFFLSALLPFILENLTASARSKKRLLAYETAYGKLEDLRQQDFDTLADGAFPVPNVDGATGQVTVAQVDLNGDNVMEADIVSAKVDVTYLEKGQAKTINLNTLITRDGVIENE
ncbi:MAG: hypothetical protein AAB632_00530 [Patescibacteria group bacterium]